MAPRSAHEQLSEQVSLGLQGLLEKRVEDPHSVVISQSVIYEDDYVFTVEDVDYYACKFQEDENFEAEGEGDSKDKLLLFSRDQIEQAKANAADLKEMMPKTVALVSMPLDIDKRSIRTDDEVAKECEYVENVMLEMFGPWDFFKMFLISFFR